MSLPAENANPTDSQPEDLPLAVNHFGAPAALQSEEDAATPAPTESPVLHSADELQVPEEAAEEHTTSPGFEKLTALFRAKAAGLSDIIGDDAQPQTPGIILSTGQRDRIKSLKRKSPDSPVDENPRIHKPTSGLSDSTVLSTLSSNFGSASSSRAPSPAPSDSSSASSSRAPSPAPLAEKLSETGHAKKRTNPTKGLFERSAQLLTHTFLIPATFLISALSLMQEVGPYGLTSAGVLGSVAFAAIVIPRLLSSFKSATKQKELEKEARKLDRGIWEVPTFKESVGLALAATTSFVESFFVISVLEKGIESGVIASLSPLGAVLTVGGLAIYTTAAFFAAREDSHNVVNLTLELKNIFTAQFWKDAKNYLAKQGPGFYFGSAFSLVLPAAFGYLAATSLPVSLPVMAVAGALSFAVAYVGSRETLTSFFQNAYKDLKWFAGFDKTVHEDKWTKSPVTRYLSYLGGLSIGASVGYSVIEPLIGVLGGPIGIAASAVIGLSMYIFSIRKAEGYFGAPTKDATEEELEDTIARDEAANEPDAELIQKQNKQCCLTQFSNYKGATDKASTSKAVDAEAVKKPSTRSCFSTRA